MDTMWLAHDEPNSGHQEMYVIVFCSNSADFKRAATHKPSFFLSKWEWELMNDAGPPNTVTFPPEDLTATLFELFFRHFTPFLPIIHQPSFEVQYRDRFHLKNTSFAMVVLLVCAIASRYCDDPRVCLKDGGRPSAGWKYFVQVKDLKRSLHAPAKLSDLQAYAVRCISLAVQR
jgi:hypothetical protein